MIRSMRSCRSALARTIDPKLAARTLEISLGDELPTSRAVYLVTKVARQSEPPKWRGLSRRRT